MLLKTLKLILLTLLTYLLQATTAQYLSVWDVAPNLALAIIAVVTVSYGRFYTLTMSLAIGYLLEIMLSGMQFFNLVLYPVTAMLGGLVFADKSERKLEELHSLGKNTRQWNPHLRIPLCALVSITVFEAVHLFYISLSGVVLDSGHIGRSLVGIFYTALLAGIFQFPLRAWLGVYKQNRENKEKKR